MLSLLVLDCVVGNIPDILDPGTAAPDIAAGFKIMIPASG